MNLMLGHFKYETNNGVPYTANWKSQSIDFSQASQYAIGWLPSNWSLGVTLPWTNITPSSSTTLAETTLMYNNLKNTNTR